MAEQGASAEVLERLADAELDWLSL